MNKISIRGGIANKYLTDDYLDVHKKTGRYPADKVAKPPYKAVVPKNRGRISPFADYLSTLPLTEIEPKVLDFKTDGRYSYVGQNKLARLYVTPNEINDLFSLTLDYAYGFNSRPEVQQLPIYMDLIGTITRTPHEFNDEMQRLGASLLWDVTRSTFSLTIEGYDEHFEETLALVEELLFSPAVDKTKMSKLRSLKRIESRTDRKSPDRLAEKLSNVVQYTIPRSHRELNYAQVARLKAPQMVAQMGEVLQTECDMHYVGTLDAVKVEKLVAKHLHVKDIKEKGDDVVRLASKITTEPLIYIFDYKKASQSIIRAYTHLEGVTPSEEDALRLYNTYLGGGMGSLLFQEIREYRSLAYGVGAGYNGYPPALKMDKGDLIVALSTQVDKTYDAISMLEQLVRLTPDSDERIAEARRTLVNSATRLYPTFRQKSKRIATLRRQGYDEDLALNNIRIARNVTKEQMIDMHNNRIAKAPFIYMIVGNAKKMDLDKLAQIGRIIYIKEDQLY